jgi:hypothetical protein
MGKVWSGVLKVVILRISQPRSRKIQADGRGRLEEQ